MVHPGQTTPGTPSFFATTIGTGPRAWPVLGIHREGRVVNLTANAEAYKAGNLAPAGSLPLHAPRAVPSANLFELQRHYSPDRITEPHEGDEVVTWDDSMAKLREAVTAATAAGKSVAYLGPYASGTLAYLINQVTEGTQGKAVFWEPLGLEAESLAAKALFDSDVLPRYNLAGANYVLSFGASFLNDSWGNPAIRSDFTDARNAERTGQVARFATVCPVRDQTGASADDWYACNPGSEAQVALAVARLVRNKVSRGLAEGPVASLIEAGDVATAVRDSGLSEEQLNEIADRFAKGGAVALPGGMLGASAQGTQLAIATYLLNLVSGAAELFTSGGYPGPVSSFKDLEALIADMSAGRIGVLLLGDLDAMQLLPNVQSFTKALERVDMTVSVTSHRSETTQHAAKLVLPTHLGVRGLG